MTVFTPTGYAYQEIDSDPIHTYDSQTYVLTGKVQRQKWPKQDWNGELLVTPIYCATFPSPDTVNELIYTPFSNGGINGGIHLSTVEYSDGLAAYIVASKIPANLTAEMDLGRMVLNEKRTAQLSGQSTLLPPMQTGFGPTIGVEVRNVLTSAPNGPYPVVKPFFKPAFGRIHSLGIHRLFVRYPDRFEVALLQQLKQPVTDSTKAEVVQRLTALVDKIVSSLQSCRVPPANQITP